MPDSEKAMDVDEVPEEVLRFTIKDVYRQALIEGDVPERGADPQKIASMVVRMRASSSFSLAACLLGPMYWAYRTCYVGAALLVVFYLLAFCALLLVYMPLESSSFGRVVRLLPALIELVGGFLFFRAYRYKADSLVEKAKASGIVDAEGICAYLRQRGGTSLPAACIAGAVYLGIALTIVAAVVLPSAGIW